MSANPIKPGRRPGVKEVAALAGVSWKTVTNVVHGRPNVRPETRRRVEEAIEQLGYRANLAGRSLRLGRTGAIALAVPEIESPYFARLAHHVIVAADRRGLIALIDETAGDQATELKIVTGGLSRQTDGIIFSPIELDTRNVDLDLTDIPIVLVGEGARNPRLDHVGIDNVAAAKEATRHLIDSGRTRIAFLGGEDRVTDSTRGQRQAGYLSALEEAGIEKDPALIQTTAGYGRRDGMEAMSRVLQAAPDADGAVCGNDLLAIGALRHLREAGVPVPDRVAVVGWDATEEGEYSNPSLTSIAPDVAELARIAVDRLVERIEGGTLSPSHRLIGHELVVRESSGSTNRSKRA